MAHNTSLANGYPSIKDKFEIEKFKAAKKDVNLLYDKLLQNKDNKSEEKLLDFLQTYLETGSPPIAKSENEDLQVIGDLIDCLDKIEAKFVQTN